jgi:hypothetical protein
MMRDRFNSPQAAKRPGGNYSLIFREPGNGFPHLPLAFVNNRLITQLPVKNQNTRCQQQIDTTNNKEAQLWSKNSTPAW